MIYLGVKTLAAIESAVAADQGATFRGLLKKHTQNLTDAFDTDTFPFRSHLGASQIGRDCMRELWYSFRWVKAPEHSGRLLRLFNRGHCEEARFHALLELIGCTVHTHLDEKQIRIKTARGHGGGSVDCVVSNIPDLPAGLSALAEYKTHSSKSFYKLVAEGMRAAKPEHYAQTNTYAGHLGLSVIVYFAVNKDNDELYIEILPFDQNEFVKQEHRFSFVVESPTPPRRISNTSSFWKCKICDYQGVCFFGHSIKVTCRTCTSARILDDGVWFCGKYQVPLDKHQQLRACAQYTPIIKSLN